MNPAPGLVHITSGQISAWVAMLVWPFLRVGALFTAAPIFGARVVPVRVRLSLALVLAWLVAVLVPAPPPVPALSVAAIVVGVQQIVIGLAMGFIVQMVFEAFALAGSNIALSMGLGFAQLIDPENGLQVPVVGQYYTTLVTLLFLALGGHLALLHLLVRSFTTLPVGVQGLDSAGLWHLVNWAGQMYAGAVLVALPALAALLLVNMAFGVITRAAPQLNIFAVGFPLTILVGFMVMLLTLPAVAPRLQSLLVSAYRVSARMTGG